MSTDLLTRQSLRDREGGVWAYVISNAVGTGKEIQFTFQQSYFARPRSAAPASPSRGRLSTHRSAGSLQATNAALREADSPDGRHCRGARFL